MSEGRRRMNALSVQGLHLLLSLYLVMGICEHKQFSTILSGSWFFQQIGHAENPFVGKNFKVWRCDFKPPFKKYHPAKCFQYKQYKMKMNIYSELAEEKRVQWFGRKKLRDCNKFFFEKLKANANYTTGQ